MRINLIGAGKVGNTLARLICRQPNLVLGDVHSRRVASAKAVTETAGCGRAVTTLEEVAAADLWLLTVPDDQIAEIAASLAGLWGGEARSPSIAVHCSGFLSSQVLAPLQNIGWAVASCHPVLSFADTETAATQFSGTYCGIEGDEAAVKQINKVLSFVGGVPFSVQTEQKALYHAAAVLSNNFTVVLQALALEAWAAAGVPEEVAKNLGNALLYNTAKNVANVGPRAALTGPAARGDVGIMRRQELVLADWQQDIGELYRLMSKMARQLKQRGEVVAPRKSSGGDRERGSDGHC